ncbi:MAG: glycosyltransferase family 4 protein [Candidatus Omnitrophica bacterium]|nr:glycosyltransferase family 4 protein [Candidatus Omnitrophota bacterium]
MLRVGMVSPPWLQVPPPGYGGIERVVYDLTERLVKRKNKVLLFAPGGSKTSAKLIPYVPEPLGQDWPGHIKDLFFKLCSKYSFTRAVYEKVDIIHDHTLHNTDLPVNVVYTLHGPASKFLVSKCREMSKNKRAYFVAISNRQKELYGQGINFAGVVHNGINTKNIPFKEKKSDYLFFIGRANWEKGLDLAVRAAVKSGMKLVMAIKMTEKFEQRFFKEKVQPWLTRYKRSNSFKLLGEITPKKKFQLYKNAKATLFTSQWEEPFGLVIIESMACGTPVLALQRGAAVEVIKDWKTGFVVRSEDEMIEAIRRIDEIDPKECRRHAEKNFSVEKMAREYEKIYKKILASRKDG